jgi:hypothetical protein
MLYGKKLVAAMALMAASSMAMAGGPVVEPDNFFNGFYVGAGLGAINGEAFCRLWSCI